jgi:asparagine synthase (glutamine-hydrolysing)
VAAIGGLFRRGSSSENLQVSLNVLMTSLSHRRPVSIGRVVGNESALVQHHLCSTTPTDREPYLLAGHTIVADVRLDNRLSLRGQLGASQQSSDQELLLRAYLKWGASCVKHLLGDFAFVVSSNTGLFCARDPMGVKPLCYARTDDQFVFASEARPVAEVVRAGLKLRLKLELNENRIADCLVFPLEHIDTEVSFYKDVYRLPPATTLSFSSAGVKTERYWRPEIGDVGWHPRKAEEFGELLTTVVQAQVDGHGALAMSGGIDSTLIAAFAAPATLTTYSTLATQGEPCAESKHIKLAQREMGLSSVVFYPDDIASRHESLGLLYSQMQEPFDYMMFQMMLLNEQAKLDGFSHMLDGVDGDLLYSLSHDYPSIMMRQGQWKKGWLAVGDQARSSDAQVLPEYVGALRKIGLPNALRFLRQIKRWMPGDPFAAVVSQSIIDPEFARKTHTVERYEAMGERLYSNIVSLDDVHLRQICHPSIPAALERYDRVAAMSGLESRHPLLDKRLIEFVLGIPNEMKVHQGWSKYLLRAAGKGRVPDKIRWRRDKDENAWHFNDQLVAGQRQQMNAVVNAQRELIRDYVDVSLLEKMDDENLLQIYSFTNWIANQ